MTGRRSLSPMQRLRLFEAAESRCHICGLIIKPGALWQLDHVRPLALHGADEGSNLEPAHVKCHAIKTKADVASIAKSKRMKAKHIGIKKRSAPFPGGRQSKWKKRMDGTVVLR